MYKTKAHLPRARVDKMGNVLTVLKYMTIIIPMVEQLIRVYKSVKVRSVARKERKKSKLRERLEKSKGAAVLVIAALIMSSCASPIFDAVRAQLPQSASSIQLDIEGFIKVDVEYATESGSEGRMSLVCEVQSTDLTGDVGLTYRCPIVGNQFGVEVAYLELDGTGNVLTVKGFDKLIYSVEVDK